MPASNATSRFSDRVENYIRYRPGYPPEALRMLESECGLTSQRCDCRRRVRHRHLDTDAAGAWQSRFTRSNRTQTCGRHPSDCSADFRKSYRAWPATRKRLRLPDESVDFVTAAQAAHWFDRGAARQEFVRILKPSGWLVLLWNERLIDHNTFSAGI